MATLESLTASRTTAPLPQPGDGIYPTIVQHDVIASASHELWAKLVSEAKENTADLHIAENLIDLLARVPELYARHSKAFSIHDEPSPQMKFALEWLTTRDTACDRPLKRTYHHQTLAALRPQKWEHLDASEDTSLWSGHQASQIKHLSRLILAWAYILSSRWVEILKTSGEKASMQQSEGISRDNFWEVIIERRWHAIVIRSDKVFYAPWSVERQTAASSVLTEAAPDSYLAFQLLESFCLSVGVTNECAAMALAVVMMFLGHEDDFDEKYYKQLFSYLGRCITLSCCDEGTASLLCSRFFEPSVPCNLVGSHLLGVRNAIEPVRNDPRVFARLMMGHNPVNCLWLAAIWTGQVGKVLESALGGMPPISVPVASWTGVPQSFVQIGYHPRLTRCMARAWEFSTIYLINDDANIPFTPSPPFGRVTTSDISLDVRRHLLHNHKPMLAKTYWVFDTGEMGLAQEQPEIIEQPILSLPSIARAHAKSSDTCQIEDSVERISSDATLNLFTWYRELEGGLWLEEIQGKHAWVTYDSDEDDSPIYSSQDSS